MRGHAFASDLRLNPQLAGIAVGCSGVEVRRSVAIILGVVAFIVEAHGVNKIMMVVGIG